MTYIITKQLDMSKNNFNELWDTIIDDGIATREECILVCNINGSRDSSLESILYARTGYRDLNQYNEFKQ
jgi:hypothetical protein